MAYETIIVAFEDAAAADEAVGCIRRMGVPSHDIRRHPVGVKGIADVAAMPDLKPHSAGFWSWLFGRDMQAEHLARYEQALERGGTVISVQVMEEEAPQVRDVLDRFGPLDLAESAAAP